MERLKRSSLFWALLLVTVALPAGLHATKQLYKANIADPAGAGKGSAVITVRPGTYDYMARTHSLTGAVVQQVWLAPTDSSWYIPLCTNGGPTGDDCAYSADGNLDIEGAIPPSMLIAAGITGRVFNDALRGGYLAIVLSDGTSVLGSGYFVRII